VTWLREPVVYNWTPHDPDVATLLPALEIPAWAETDARARTTLFLVVALAVRWARAQA
jgi:hypothetical protein